MDKPKLYNLVYYVSKKRVETLQWNQPMWICVYWREQYRLTCQYTTGSFKFEPIS